MKERFRKLFSFESSDFLPLAIIFVLSATIVGVWFREGLILGTGESGLPFYDITSQYERLRYSWKSQKLGIANGTTTASLPTYWFLSLFQKAGVPNFLVQALFFFLIFFAAGVSIYYLTKELFREIEKKYLLISTFFYLFNPFALVNVWRRFLYNYMVFYAFLPLAILIFYKGLRKKSYLYSLIFAIASVVFSYALSSAVFNLILWGTLGYLVLFNFWTKQNEFLFLLKYSFLTLLLFLTFNLWWVGQYFSFIFSPSIDIAIDKFFNASGNIGTLTALSHRLGQTTFVTRMMHTTFFEKGPPWASLYTNILSTLLSFLIVAVVFWVLVKFYKKNKKVLLLGTLFVIGIFLSKGNNPPFGEIYQQVFEKITLLQIFRNPFEKFGFLLPVSSAPLFAFGLSKLNFKRQIFNKLKTSLAFLVLVVVWGLPFWSGKIYIDEDLISGVERKYAVRVPEYYKDASNWLDSQEGDFYFIGLPMSGEGMTYTWEKPYSGVELTSKLFDVSNISFVTTSPFLEDLPKSVKKSFNTGMWFDQLANKLNAKYILVRSDLNWEERMVTNPELIKRVLSDNYEGAILDKVAEFGEIEFYENIDWDNRKIYTTNKVALNLPYSSISDVGVMTGGEDLYQGSDYDHSAIVARPEKTIRIDSAPNLTFEIRQDIFPHVRFLPDSPLYRLVITKEKIEKFYAFNRERWMDMSIPLLGKRLHEAKIIIENQEDEKLALNPLKNYSEDFKEVSSKLFELNTINRSTTGSSWREKSLYGLFSRHLYLIESLKEQSDDGKVQEELAEMRGTLEDELVHIGVLPYYRPINTEDFPLNRRIIFQFEVNTSKDYELLLDGKSWQDYFHNSYGDSVLIQIDDELRNVSGTVEESGLVSFGKFFFEKGVHEVSFNTPEQKNLINFPSSEITFNVVHGEQTRDFEILNYDPFANYEVELEYFIEKGVGPEIMVLSGGRGSEAPIYQFKKKIEVDEYFFGTRNFSGSFSPPQIADSADLRIRITPWNNCLEIFGEDDEKRCEEEEFRSLYDRESKVVIYNAEVRRKMFEDIWLRSVSMDDSKETKESPKIKYKSINPAKYEIEIEDAKEDFYLIFSQVFDPRWTAKYMDGNKLEENSHFLTNGFANGWRVDRKGDYKIMLKFAPEDFYQSSKKVSLGFLTLGFVFLLYKTRRNLD